MSSGSTRSRSAAANVSAASSNDSPGSSGTEDYEIPRARNRNDRNQNIIEINDTQQPPDNDDDDVVLIPNEIITIDLCTQVLPAAVPNDLNNQIIDITDSPVPNVVQTRARRSGGDSSGPQRPSRRNNARTSPYAAGPSTSKNTSPKPKPAQPYLNDSQAPDPVYLTCPICLESVSKREPVTTMCGHIFCKACIRAAITATSKKCPMCKKGLTGKTPYIQIFLG